MSDYIQFQTNQGLSSLCLFSPELTDWENIELHLRMLWQKAEDFDLTILGYEIGPRLPATNGTLETGTLWPRRAMIRAWAVKRSETDAQA